MSAAEKLIYAERIAEYEQALNKTMGNDGPFSEIVPGYKSREMQIAMAHAITQAIINNETLIAEAGTGTGKTFAYLIPALQWGGKVIISTGTRNLQDQLFLRDIPTVRKALCTPVSVALLKGRANYVCHYHLNRTCEQGLLESKNDTVYLRQIVQFAQMSDTGDRSELASVPETASVWHQVSSTRENCLGKECPYFNECFLAKARRQAQQADVVVVNHHLFFADMVLKDTGFGELLPAANTVIFDEAHQLPDIATRFFGEFISTSRILDLCRDILVEGRAQARDAGDWTTLTGQLDKAARDIRLTLPEKTTRISVEKIEQKEKFIEAIEHLHESLKPLEQLLDSQSERTQMFQNCHEQAVEIQTFLEKWISIIHGDTKTDQVVWTETFGSATQLHLTPLSVADVFSKQREQAPKAWIFTSATLSVKKNFSYFASRLGLEQARAEQWPSPFNFSENALLYVPMNMPQPNESGYSDAVVNAALPLITVVDGGTFILCTSLRAVDWISSKLRVLLHGKTNNRPILVQGESSKTDLLDRFRRNGKAILIGSQSFWEGVDVRGRALSLVIVDRLPFASPDDPVLAARLEALKHNGGNGFMSYQVPEATISLRQGAGRLIRDEQDCGVLMICDTRLVNRRYGSSIWQSLPPFQRTRDEKIACDFLMQHSLSSTQKTQ